MHDVSWGTKGSTEVAHDLGVVKSSSAEKDKVDVDIPKDEQDIDAAYEDAKHVLAQKAPVEVKKVCIDRGGEDRADQCGQENPVERAENSFRNIRTNVVRTLFLCHKRELH